MVYQKGVPSRLRCENDLEVGRVKELCMVGGQKKPQTGKKCSVESGKRTIEVPIINPKGALW
jgi:hypothetical protein